MPEDFVSLPAMNAGDNVGFNVRDPATFPVAFMLEVHTLDFVNNSSGVIKVRVNGRVVPIAAGAPGHIVISGGHVTDFQVMPAAATSAGDVLCIAKGDVHRSLAALYSQGG
jgi:hypothetical protein